MSVTYKPLKQVASGRLVKIAQYELWRNRWTDALVVLTRRVRHRGNYVQFQELSPDGSVRWNVEQRLTRVLFERKHVRAKMIARRVPGAGARRPRYVILEQR